MDQDQIEPQQQQNNQNVQTDGNPPEVKSKKPSKPTKIIIAVTVIAIILGAGLGLVLLNSDKDQNNSSVVTNENTAQNTENITSPEPQAIEQIFISPVDGVETEIEESKYYTITVGNDDYYGQIRKINQEFIRLTPTAKRNGNTLTFTGNELHGPEDASYFQISKVTNFQELADATIIDAIKNQETSITDAFPSKKINDYIKAGQFQAYFFSDGSAYFARTSTLDNGFLTSSGNVYVLNVEKSNSPSPQISLAVAASEQIANLTIKDLVYWQNMKNDSQISTAATQYEKNQ